MLQGFLDSVTSAGFIEGWAFDTSAPARPVTVSVYHNGVEVASGIAHRFRSDLAAAGCGIGWSAFSLKTNESPRKLRQGSVQLIERASKVEIFSIHNLYFRESGIEVVASVEALATADPTIISSIDQLRGCQVMFAAFIRRFGVEPFIRAAYAYVLGRPADQEGLANYANCVRKAILTPFGVIQVLMEGDEFRRGARQLGAPNTSAFPFYLE